jgi:hypothetical protein
MRVVSIEGSHVSSAAEALMDVRLEALQHSFTSRDQGVLAA